MAYCYTIDFGFFSWYFVSFVIRGGDIPLESKGKIWSKVVYDNAHHKSDFTDWDLELHSRIKGSI